MFRLLLESRTKLILNTMKKIISRFFILLCTLPVFAQPNVTRTLMWDGVQRQYLESVPASISQSNPAPVIFCLHGLGATMNEPTNWGFRNVFPGWVIISPQALMGHYIDGSEAGNAWNSGASAQIPGYGYLNVNPDTDDPGFLMAILDSLQRNYPVNTDSVFFMGYSMGGFMSQKMAILHGDRIKGVASVSGTIGNELAQTMPVTSVNVLHIHGTDDPTVRYADAGYDVGGQQYYSLGLGAEQTVAFWQNYNQCSPTPEVTDFPDTRNDGKTFQRSVYTNSDNGNRVALIKVNNGKHEWYYTPQNDIDYATEIYNFFTGGLPAQITQKDRLLADFEDQTTGIFASKGTHLTMSVVANPDKSGENLSDYVLEITATSAVENWEAIYSASDPGVLHIPIGYNSEDEYRYLHFKVYKTFTSTMLWGFYTHDGTSFSEKLSKEQANTKTNEWEYVVFDLLALDGVNTWNISPGIYKRINFNFSKNRQQAYTGYIDNVYLSNSPDRIPDTDIPTGINNRKRTTTDKATVFRLDKSRVQVRINPELKGSPKLEVYNVQGQLIRSIGNEQAAAKSFEVNLPAGSLYILRVSDAQGVYSIRF
jgi:poly(3-hydroxybutyrate) depolymerase